MTISQRSLTITPEAYLQREERATTKSEYRAGVLFPMAGSTTNHNRIAVSACSILDRTLVSINVEVPLRQIYGGWIGHWWDKTRYFMQQADSQNNTSSCSCAEWPENIPTRAGRSDPTRDG
ncbi:MAG TPA: hypothetical protein P5121_27345 [Caldilineaceae bacterium]|nr:hypothetical protein [Caldilineaceae bacterium]